MSGIAEAVDYQTDTAFSRAFRREFGKAVGHRARAAGRELFLTHEALPRRSASERNSVTIASATSIAHMSAALPAVVAASCHHSRPLGSRKLETP